MAAAVAAAVATSAALEVAHSVVGVLRPRTDSRELWLQSIWSRANELRTRQQSQTRERQHRIHRVPKEPGCGEDFQSNYEPSAVSIGPYHHGETKLQQVEDLKHLTASLFMTEWAGERVMPHIGFLDRFAEKIEGVREWYDEDSTRCFDEEKFIQMMFLDGCFIFMFIACFLSFGVEVLGLTKETITLVQRDIFMLENQLPYRVLEALCIGELRKSDLFWMLDRYICYCTIGSNRHFGKGIGYEYGNIKPLHLLDLLRIRWVGKDKFEDHYSIFPNKFMRKRITTSRLVRNIKELTASAIFLRPNSTNQLSDIRFSNCLIGRLALPPIIIDGSTETVVLNAIAREACVKNHFGITSYVSFLDSLIDSADDVKVMRSAGVLENFLGSDEQVASLFNTIGAVLKVEAGTDSCIGVKMDIGNYFASCSLKIKVANCLAEVIRSHFRSPLTTIALLVGFLAISLTVVQTYFTIYPVQLLIFK